MSACTSVRKIKLVAVFGCAMHVSRIRDSGSIGPSWAGGVRVLFGSGGLRAYTLVFGLVPGRLDWILLCSLFHVEPPLEKP